MSDIKLVASDMDGTLLDCNDYEKCKVNPDIIPVINDLKNKKIYFSILTGRNYLDAYQILESIKIKMLTPGFIIGYNGAQIFNVENKKLIINKFASDSEKTLFIKAYKIALKNDFNNFLATFFCKNNIGYIIKNSGSNFNNIVNKMVKLAENNHIIDYIIIDNFNEIQDFYKAEFFYYEKNENALAKIELYQKFVSKINFQNSGEHFIEVLPENVNKGTAIGFLKKFYKIKSDNILAIGDSGNDLSMFAAVKNSATRDCASDNIKAAVTNVFSGGQSTFVANALNYFIK